MSELKITQTCYNVYAEECENFVLSLIRHVPTYILHALPLYTKICWLCYVIYAIRRNIVRNIRVLQSYLY